jgi:hypothetical protein
MVLNFITKNLSVLPGIGPSKLDINSLKTKSLPDRQASLSILINVCPWTLSLFLQLDGYVPGIIYGEDPPAAMIASTRPYSPRSVLKKQYNFVSPLGSNIPLKPECGGLLAAHLHSFSRSDKHQIHCLCQ